ncbi:unknown [Brachyspira sp. CAG:484]|mgnify:CR=1 FL=1|nr:unknown [Brachyspira sp. CAG:484]
MCRIIEGRLNEAITKLQDIIVVQEDNLTRLNDERIREQAQRLQEAVDILRTSNEAKIVNYAERVAREIGSTSNANQDINLDNWIILVSIHNLFTDMSTSWTNIENSLDNQKRIMDTIRGNNNA